MDQSGNDPAYAISTPYPPRTPARDKAALEKARKALRVLKRYRKRQAIVAPVGDNPSDLGITPALNLQPRCDDKVDWKMPGEAFAAGARRWNWGGVGFPEATSIVLDDFEEKIHVNTYDVSIEELAQDILAIKEKAPGLIADAGVRTEESFGRKIERFHVNKRSVVKITIDDADVLKGAYSKLRIAKDFESRVDGGFMPQPELEIEQYMAAEIVLRMGGAVSFLFTQLSLF